MVILLLQMHRNFQSGQPFRAAPCSSPLLNTEPVCTQEPGTRFRDRGSGGPGFPQSLSGEAQSELVLGQGSLPISGPAQQPQDLTLLSPGGPWAWQSHEPTAFKLVSFHSEQVIWVILLMVAPRS